VRKTIGECLIQAGLISHEDLQSALVEHKRTGERIGVVLVRMNLATETQIAKALARQLGFPYVNLTENPPDPRAVAVIPKDVALERVCVAIACEKNRLTVAMSDPLVFSLVEDLEFQTGCRVEQVVAARGDIVDAIEMWYPDTPVAVRAHPADDLAIPGREAAAAAGTPAPIVDLVDRVLTRAIETRASDIHVEPMEKGVLIRNRLDGILNEVMDLPRWAHEALIARLKMMAGMDAAEKRLPQDGRLRSKAEDGTDVDFRVSTLRTLFGEKIVLRRLDHRKDVPSLEDIGLSATALEHVRGFLRHQHGMVLVVGPTGSGKTTTLSASLRALQSENANIVSIEDPIEYLIPGVNQTRIGDTIELTFAGALRSVLLQDPDVVLLGDIRDGETAAIALQAAQTGQLVLSALYTDNAPSAVTRLMDMGAEPFVVASALVGVIGQRLVRRLCVHCRRPSPPSETMRSLNISETDAASITFYESVGCDQCSYTGYRGRIGIYEVMRITDRLRRLIAGRATEDQLRDAVVSGGMVTLGEDGLAKVKSGVTTADELLRVVTDVREMRTLCSGCGSAVGVDFNACPHCGKRIGGGCPHCGRALLPGWNFCPYCARSTSETRAPKQMVDNGVIRPLPAGRRHGTAADGPPSES